MPENENYRVNATELNLRREPEVKAGNVIAQLPFGHRVRKLGVSPSPDWWRVSTVIQGTALEGFVRQQYLTPADQFDPPPPHNRVTEVHLSPSKPVRRSQTSGHAFPLNENGQPRRTGTTGVDKAAELGRIIRWLDVSQSARYLPAGGSTFCNIYAFDYCYLSGAYLPRVWWTATAIAKLTAGQAVAPEYGVTVTEKNANSLFDWLREFGADFGWMPSFDLTDIQRAANDGQVAIICAQRKDLNRSGHICLVVPETPDHHATRIEGQVMTPLQSQAGVTNFSYGGRRWWTEEQFRRFGFWIHV
jgi:hypothetical protein